MDSVAEPCASRPVNLFIAPSGRVVFVYDDAMAALSAQGLATTRRASHVEPSPEGGWSVDLSPFTGVTTEGHGFERRGEALDFERGWLEGYLELFTADELEAINR